jgi:hypothetical protein
VIPDTRCAPLRLVGGGARLTSITIKLPLNSWVSIVESNHIPQKLYREDSSLGYSFLMHVLLIQVTSLAFNNGRGFRSDSRGANGSSGTYSSYFFVVNSLLLVCSWYNPSSKIHSYSKSNRWVCIFQEVGVKGAAILAGQWLGWHSTLSPGGKSHVSLQ